MAARSAPMIPVDTAAQAAQAVGGLLSADGSAACSRAVQRHLPRRDGRLPRHATTIIWSVIATVSTVEGASNPK